MMEMTHDGSQYPMMNSTDSGSENLYFQMALPVEEREKLRRPVYNRSINAIENWGQLTHGLMELKKIRMQ